MGRYPRAGKFLLAALDGLLTSMPILSPRKYFKWTKRERAMDEIHRTSAICFVARKPALVT
jgi:hypothetical protein